MASTNISRTQTGGNRKTWTLSVWLKRANIDGDMVIFKSYTSANDHIYVRFNSNNDMYMESATGGASKISFTTNRKFVDIGAWMNVCLKVDMSQATSTDRWKLFINGVDEADVGGYSSSNYASQNDDLAMNLNGATLYIGSHQSSGEYFSGIMSHFAIVDGTAHAVTDFGEVDATSGIFKWKAPNVSSWGTNGIHLKMEDSTNVDLDSSSNAHTMTTGGTLTPTKDNPSINYCRGNTLMQSLGGGGTFTVTNGGNTWYKSVADWKSFSGTLGMIKSKWYWEIKYASGSSEQYTGVWNYMACADNSSFGSSLTNGSQGHAYAYKADGWKLTTGDSGTSGYGDTWASGDIIGTALDLDNGKIYFSKNGTWQNSGVPTSGATGTGSAYDVNISTSDCIYLPAFTLYNNTMDLNFGDGYFGTTAVATNSGNGYSDANGQGKMNYEVPTGYYILNSKNISAYGG